MMDATENRWGQIIFTTIPHIDFYFENSSNKKDLEYANIIIYKLIAIFF